MVFVTPLIEEMNHLAKYETGEIVFGILSKTLFCKTILPAVGELHRFTGHMKLRVHLAFVLEKGLWWHMSLDHCSPLALKTSYTKTPLPSKLPLLYSAVGWSLACLLVGTFCFSPHTSPFLSHRAHLKSPHHDEGAEATGFH